MGKKRVLEAEAMAAQRRVRQLVKAREAERLAAAEAWRKKEEREVQEAHEKMERELGDVRAAEGRLAQAVAGGDAEAVAAAEASLEMERQEARAARAAHRREEREAELARLRLKRERAEARERSHRERETAWRKSRQATRDRNAGRCASFSQAYRDAKQLRSGGTRTAQDIAIAHMGFRRYRAPVAKKDHEDTHEWPGTHAAPVSFLWQLFCIVLVLGLALCSLLL